LGVRKFLVTDIEEVGGGRGTDGGWWCGGRRGAPVDGGWGWTG
jgi:hypothetical protein